MSQFHLFAAANTEVPAFLALREKGYAVRCERSATDERWTAEKPGVSFDGDSPLQLLGLVALYEARGVAWRAADDEIESFLEMFHLR